VQWYEGPTIQPLDHETGFGKNDYVFSKVCLRKQKNRYFKKTSDAVCVDVFSKKIGMNSNPECCEAAN
jgi:hypothetical protein